MKFRDKYYDNNMLLKDFVKELENETKEEIKYERGDANTS